MLAAAEAEACTKVAAVSAQFGAVRAMCATSYMND